jgi:carboxyl-terminal processing protease
MSYINSNRAALKAKYPDFTDYNSNFIVNEEMLKDLLRMYEVEIINTKPGQFLKQEDDSDEDYVLPEDILSLNQENMLDFQKSTPLIKLQIKALIARELWEANDYYKIINEENTILKKAIEIIKDTKEYNKLLGNKR